MKERGILFSAPMMRANMAGIKTQTRRAVKGEFGKRDGVPTLNGQPLVDCPAVLGQCKYGRAGDRLWARETHSRAGCKENCGHLGCRTIYRAEEKRALGAYGAVKWVPSIHMPRWASRFTADIVNVRVERLKDISEADALAEGVTFDGRRWNVEGIVTTPISAVDAYFALWAYINGRESLNANPYLWVVEYKPVTP